MKQLLTLLALIISFLGKVQTTSGKISGNVIDGSSKTVESATIALLKAKDSLTIKYSIADKNGNFVFDNIPNGRYLVSVSIVGHQKGFSAPLELSDANQTVQLQPIQMVALPKAMSNVTITAKRPFIEQKIDKMVINVESSITSAGASALDVLEKSPGITIDKDGNISLKGKQSVMVMMDGKPAYLSGADLVNYLRSLPSSAIDQIEIMTNPSAKYDAAGNSGIINIRSKKNRQTGFNGNLTLGYQQGVYWKSNNSLNLNYRLGKVNMFMSTSTNKGNSFNELDIVRKFKDAATKDIEAIFEQQTRMRNENQFSNLKIGADYFVSKKTTLGFVTSGFLNPGTFGSKSTSYLKNAGNVVDSIVYAESAQDKKWKNGTVNLNFRYQFDSTGREITSDLDYITYRQSQSQDFFNKTFNPDWTLRQTEILRGNLPVNVDIYSAKVDYTQPIGKEAKLEAGVKSSYVNTDNLAQYFTISNASESPDYSKTNHFDYKENINAAYLSVNRQFAKVGAQLGLRYENTSYSGRQFGNPTRTDSSFKNNYGNLFPTLFLSYKADKNNQFGFSFGRRVDRPAYQDLNPFLFFLDKFTYEAGNPFLKPQYTNNVEVSHSFRNFLTTTINYSRTVNDMNETFEQQQDVNGNKGYATIVRRGNIGKRDGAGIAISAQVPVVKWWNTSLYTNYNYNRFKGRLNGDGEYIDIAAGNLLFNINNQFKFNKGWSAELSAFYRSKGVDGQIIMRPMGQLAAGVGKQVLKNKGTVRFNVRDILYTSKASGDINFENTMAHFVNTRDSRVGSITFTYRFGKPIKNLPQKRKTGGADDEQNRVKVAG